MPSITSVVAAAADPPGVLTDDACHAQEDERIRNNRLALLRKIESLPKGIAELSVLPGF